jgi:hypothetical protein
MHQQIRLAVPASSPPNLEKVLESLEAAGINIIAAGGSNVEHGGEFGFAVDHDQQEAALAVLREAHLRPRVVDVTLCLLDNRPGALRDCISNANQGHRPGRLIRDIAVGVPEADGRVPVQVYFDDAS